MLFIELKNRILLDICFLSYEKFDFLFFCLRGWCRFDFFINVNIALWTLTWKVSNWIIFLTFLQNIDGLISCWQGLEIFMFIWCPDFFKLPICCRLHWLQLNLSRPRPCIELYKLLIDLRLINDYLTIMLSNCSLIILPIGCQSSVRKKIPF